MTTNRKIIVMNIILVVLLSAFIIIFGDFFQEKALITDFTQKNLSPSLSYIFGTDWLGRDMFSRTIFGLSVSIKIGIITSIISTIIALILGTISAIGGKFVDDVVTWLIDLIMGIPHLLLLILISFALGRGTVGVLVGVSLTHWASLARVIRAEVMQLKNSGYIKVAKKLGVTPQKIVLKHILPHILPQLFAGFILTFPHAILHEASITFLGFGLPATTPSVGAILSESMRYLTTGKWWLAVFPGASLLIVVLSFYYVGEKLKEMLHPNTTNL